MQADRPITVSSYGSFELQHIRFLLDEWKYPDKWTHVQSASEAGRLAADLGTIHTFGPSTSGPPVAWGCWMGRMLEALRASDAQAAPPDRACIVGAHPLHRMQIRRAVAAPQQRPPITFQSPPASTASPASTAPPASVGHAAKRARPTED